MKTIAILLSALPLLAQVAEPRAGVVTGRDGVVREVIGVAGASLPGDTLLAGALRTAASADFWVAKLDHSLRTSRGEEFDAPAGDARIGFSADGTAAWIYFPAKATRSFWRLLRSGGVDTSACRPERSNLLTGTILALAGDLTLYIRRNDGLRALTLRTTDCAIESDTPLDLDAALAVALADGTLVFARDTAVVIRDKAGNQYPFDLPERVDELHQMADGWVHVRTASANFALRIATRQIYLLPEVTQ